MIRVVVCKELSEAAAAAGPDTPAPADAHGQQQPAGMQQQQQPAEEPDEQRQPAAVASPMLPELSLAASLSFNDQEVGRQAADEEAEVSSRAGRDGNGDGDNTSDGHDEAFEFRRRPNAVADAGQT
jgi:hypothetical protein